MISRLIHGCLFHHLEELVAPVAQTLVAVGGLLVVGASVVLQPVHEQVAVLLQHEELAKHNISLKIKKMLNGSIIRQGIRELIFC